jgi:superfamily II DNA or RNA helicase
MYMQQVGRALRPKDQPAVILDHAGNIARHGLPDDDREWTLEGKAKDKKKASSTPAPRICVSCFAAFASSASACPHCGTAVAREQRVLSENDGELVEVDPAELRRQRAMQEARAETIDDWIGIARARGYAKPEAWAAHRMTARASRGTRFEDARAAQQKRW